jgi:hypothetical protein
MVTSKGLKPKDNAATAVSPDDRFDHTVAKLVGGI